MRAWIECGRAGDFSRLPLLSDVDELRGKRLTYTGEVAAKAEYLTAEQVIPALSPPGYAASVAAEDLCEPGLRRLQTTPGLMMSNIQGSLRRGEFKMMKQLQAQMSEELASRLGQRRRSVTAGDNDD